MKKVRFALAACMLALFLTVFACGGRSRTVMINTSSSLFYNGVTMEVTLRELTIDGNDAAVRIRFLNRSSDTMSSVGARVEFVDETGDALYTVDLSEPCDYPIPTGDGVSATAECSGKDVPKITSVRGSQLDG